MPVVCQDWAATKAAYRFFRNERVDESVVLTGHFAAATDRFTATSGTVLVLHHSTEFSFRRDGPGKVDQFCRVKARRTTHTVCGLLMHAALVLTTDGLPLGLETVKFWNRKKFKSTRALRNRVNLARIPIDPRSGQFLVSSWRTSRDWHAVQMADRTASFGTLLGLGMSSGERKRPNVPGKHVRRRFLGLR